MVRPVQGYGNSLVNVIHGNSGNNLLDGGAGADVMYGGPGNDSYLVDNPADLVIENVNEGTDTVYSTAHLRLTANVENLVLQGVADLQGYGNDLVNVIYGNSGNNLLDGGAGADTMYGGVGNDAYFVDNPGDTIVEYANEGIDTVYSTADLRLGANVEYLVLQGTADLQGYGNDLVNVIYGNSGNNILDGGIGADTMYGGAGNDAYFVDNPGDTVVEYANEGIDDVYSSANLRLTANVENLHLIGTADLQGYGNALANILIGNSGANLLDGGGGADTLYGNGGNDTFFFRKGEANGDTVVDFAGSAAGGGDRLLFADFGAGATFTQNDATHWEVNYNAGASHEVIAFSNAAAIHATDYSWM
jgi:Ca2+-binding RTX toxin-like protein